ncbi:MAG: N-acetylmuramoyl-L-alanine amidase [Eubacteriales bacterium]|nr:N-acetylmuramoyl-L-alanine amidase [Eubacteriales bacterium]
MKRLEFLSDLTCKKIVSSLLIGFLFMPVFSGNIYAEDASNQASILNKASDDTAMIGSPSESSSSIFDAKTNSADSNGYVIGIDPGHQAESVDMSAMEENGPGSSEMKMKCTTGTEGSYTGLPEYELNLQISLQLRDELESRGYSVVMTRTDNFTAISNKERALYAAESGSDIYVRIHANGDDSHTVSGALTMSPSASNPYVAALYDDSNRLSQVILDSYCEATGFRNLGIQYTDTMTGINWSRVPVTILEMGFMSYESDDRQMADPEFQKTMVTGIANGIDAYFGIDR